MTMDARVLMALVGLIVGCYGAVLASTRYVHKVKDKMEERAAKAEERITKAEDCIEGELKELTRSVDTLRLKVTNRLTAIETVLKKGVGDDSSE